METVLVCAGILLECMILVRALQQRLLARYAYFYSYALSVLLGTLLLSAVRMIRPSLYPTYYWSVQFVTLLFGYGILLEIIQQVLSPYPGAERFARRTGVGLLAGILCFALVYSRLAPGASHGQFVVEFERDLRTVQTLLLFSLLAVISYYGIPVGRNMKGMIVGYGLYVGTSLISLAVRAYAGAWLATLWVFAQPISFTISLAIWLVALWSYAPNPAPGPAADLEEDYGTMAHRTRAMINLMRTHLFKSVRS
ncbi:MAG: hypothetical protein LAN59_01955 [Acidobacteriia bacterium]|nr:hypothetical protein [Terriglobia bacterium]